MFMSLFCMFSFQFCVLCFCTVLCLVSPHVVVAFLFMCKCTDHCHVVETQLQLINIIMHQIINRLISFPSRNKQENLDHISFT
jgi:hypothetical protein